MKNYGTKKYAFIPANDNLFDFSLKLAKCVLFRSLRNWRFNNRKNKQINDTERAKSFGDNNYDILLNCKYIGYKVLIYSSNQNPYSNKKLNSKFGFLVKLGLVEEIIENIDADKFDNLILKYNISTVNSIFITDDVETWRKLYNKYHPDNTNKLNNVKRHEFAIKYWNDGGDHFIYPNLFNNSHPYLYSLFYHESRPNRLIFSLQRADFVQNQVIYIGADNDDKITAYIDQNYELIKKKLAEKDLTFIYFPKLKDDIEELLKIIKPAFNYTFPQFNNQDFAFIKSFFESMTAKEYYNFIIDALQLPDFPKPSLLKNLHNIYEGEENLFYSFPLDENIGTDLMPYIERTVKANAISDGEEWFQKPKEEPKYNADDSFEWEATKISDEIKSKIEFLSANGKHKALAEMVIHICSTLKDTQPALFEKIKALNISENKAKLSQMVIDKNHRIFLPDYGNIEIVMPPLPKTLYLFFLQHPNGIMLHDLMDHKKELLSIYNKITNSSEPTEIIKRIDDMVDMTNNSINEKCSRIKEAFVSKIDDSLAQHYYVNGKRGATKKVSIPSNLVVFK
jgi:hypothetical protein